jgi:arylsulfatase A-like enzyme
VATSDGGFACDQGLDHPAGRYNYYTQAVYVDYQVGRLLDFIDNRNQTGNTLVIFASDHGAQSA